MALVLLQCSHGQSSEDIWVAPGALSQLCAAPVQCSESHTHCTYARRRRRKGRPARAEEADKENTTADGSGAALSADKSTAAPEEFDGTNGMACLVDCVFCKGETYIPIPEYQCVMHSSMM